MIKQSFINSDSILEKKFKILRMSIMLGNSRNREETLREYEETARDIDKYKKSLYEEILSSKMYMTTTLEEERDRLKDLITFIEKRIDERNEFIDDYLKITNNFLDNIDRVQEEDNLSEYRDRLDNIQEYLNNVSEIESIKKNLDEKRHELEEKYENKANNEVINSKLEEELIDEFNKIITGDEYYKGLNYIEIDSELEKIDKTLNEKRDVMNTFISSYDALKSAGISGAEREEYLSYVQDAKYDYYKCLENKYVLEIYKLVLDKESDYDRLYEKRSKIDRLLNDRDNDRKELNINERDILEYFSKICQEQFSIIKAQKFNMENIDKLILEITNSEERLEVLENNNNRPEIVRLLEEYSVDRPVIEKIEMPEEKKIHDEIISKNIDNSPKPANMVIRIEEPIKMNVKTASDTAKLVMKKVVIVLEPKKFNGKKEKIKEAELELEERKRREKIEEQENTNCFYFIATDKIILNKDKKYFTRVQTIAHECIHSIQDKKILWFNYIFANLLNIFWLITIVLTIAGVITQYALFSAIILICIIIFYAIRSHLEIEAMTKAKYIAKEYLEEKQVKETDEIVEEYEKLNDVGIKYTCYKLISSKLYLLAIYTIIGCILNFIR